MTIPRPEYPRPQFVRSEWLCLNGEWQFECDPGDSGLDQGYLNRELSQKITVPFCPESPLSGIGHTDFLRAVWYRRIVTIPESWSGKRILLHLQAVDYDATVWANGTEVGRHRGGFTPFTCDLTTIAQPGETVTLVVRARDDPKAAQPRGKQSTKYAPHSCFYTRTTGIWQTVWMEPVPKTALKRPRITPDVANSTIRLELPLTGNRPGLRLTATLNDQDGIVTEASCRADFDLSPRLDLAVPEDRCRLWSPSDPHLYHIEITLVDGDGMIVDRASSYAGLRSIALDGQRVKINGTSVFQRLVLDQGYYPDGVMTAPTDKALAADILLAQAAGYNGARLHQKVFEERFLYHADCLGYLVWGEFADWGSSGFGPSHEYQQHGITYAAQWLEVLERDYSHPSIVGWCALNETWQTVHDRITTLDDTTRALFLAAKAMDTTRPVLDTSGYSHRLAEADVYDSHDYIYDEEFQIGFEKFKTRHARLADGVIFSNQEKDDAANMQIPSITTAYRGQPYFVSEFGGFKWKPGTELRHAEDNETGRKTSWGYGSDPVSLEDFYQRFEAVCRYLLENPHMFGYCYTQLTDVYPEENGIYTFDREPKFDLERIRSIQQQPAAIERDA